MLNSTQRLWISYSGISDFEKCPHLYYLKNIYHTPVTGRKIQVANPFLTLGTVVHRVTEEISLLPPEKRKDVPLKARFERIWNAFSGKKGGFVTQAEEEEFRQRGLQMIERLERSDILYSPCYPIGDKLPKVQLFKDKNIVLVGNVDWVEILPDNSIHIIDFKTGKMEEDEDSLQLPIYLILGAYNFPDPIKKISYWYLDREEVPIEKEVKPYRDYIPLIQEKALKIAEALYNNRLECISAPQLCEDCKLYEKIIAGEAEYVGLDRKMNREIYYVNK